MTHPIEGGLSELISSLEAASEGSRELDALVFCAAHGHAFERWSELRETGFIYRRPSGVSVCSLGEDEKPYTTSIDAAVALIERKLPGWTLANLSQEDDKTWFAELREGFLTSYRRVIHSSSEPGRLPSARPPTPALALCIALLRALRALQDQQVTS